MFAVSGVAMLAAAVLLFAFAAQLRDRPAAPVWSRRYAWTASVPLVITCLLVLGMACVWRYAHDLAGPWNVVVAIAALVLPFPALAGFRRLLAGPARPEAAGSVRAAT